MSIIYALFTGFVTDVIFGDPAWLFHPVVLFGKMTTAMEHTLRRIFPKTPRGESAAGAVTSVITTGSTFLASYLMLYFLKRLNLIAGFILEAIWCYQCLAVKDMLKESHNVYKNLITEDIEKQRRAVGRIVGRDTEYLNREGIITACIESVAESLNDGVIAPVFFAIIGGAPLGLTYKAINTMDSMVGYKNERYFYFGKIPAHLDDIANYIPARISALLIVMSAWICREKWKEAFWIWRRDGRRHASPNSGQTEAAMAGALDIRLGGPASYFGEIYEKPYIGDRIKQADEGDILRANKLFFASSVLGVIIAMAARFAMILIIASM